MNKLLSGRFLSTVLIVGTYCTIILGSLLLMIKDKMTAEVFLGIFAGFSTLAGTIVKSYFEKERKENEETGT